MIKSFNNFLEIAYKILQKFIHLFLLNFHDVKYLSKELSKYETHPDSEILFVQN